MPAQAGEWRISFRAVRHAGRRHPARRTRPASYQPRPGTPGYVWQPRSQLVSRAVGVLTPGLGAGDAAISADGRYVAYTSYSGDLPGATPDNEYADVFRYDRQTGATLLVSSGAGAPGNGDSWGADISADGSVIVDGTVPIRDLNRALDWKLPDDEAVTVAGLVIHEAQTIPNPGQAFTFHGFRFEVLRRQKNRITALKVTKLETGGDEKEQAAAS